MFSMTVSRERALVSWNVRTIPRWASLYEATPSIEHVIVDTAAFIANTTNQVRALYSMHDVPQSYVQYTGAKLYTTAECLAEIRSESALTAAKLTIDDVLVRTPTDEALEFGAIHTVAVIRIQ